MSASVVADSTARHDSRTAAPPGWRRLVGRSLVLTALSVWMTWPLAAHLSTSVVGAGDAELALVYPDTYLTVWIVAWVARAVVVDPAQLFEANIFHPAAHALAYSEHMLGVLPVTLPAYWATGNPVFAHQLLMLSTFVLCGLSMAALVWDWTGSEPAALVAACLYAFARYRMESLVSVHVLVTFYFPLVLLYSSRYLRAGRLRDLALSGVTLLAQALCAYSIAYPLFAAVLPFWIVEALVVRGPARRLAALLAAGAATGVVLALLSLDILAVQALGVTEISPAHEPAVMLRTSGVRPLEWITPGSSIFAGYTAYGLGLVAVLFALRDRGIGARLLVLAAFALPLAVLGLGPHAPLIGGGLSWVWATVPGLAKFRVARRFAFHAALPLAVAGGIAVAAIDRRLRSSAARWGGPLAWSAAALLIAAICWERGLSGIFVARRALPPVYGWLLAQGDPRDPVLEVPAGIFGPLGPRFADAEHTFWSAFHRFPLVNGYSGSGPAGYELVLDLIGQLPNPDALQVLERLTGARWLVVHSRMLTPAERARWEDPPGLHAAARFGDDTVFALPVADADWRAAYRQPDGERTLSGLPLPAAGVAAQGSVRLQAPATVAAGEAVAVAVTLRNSGRAPWPALAIAAGRRVGLELWWQPEGVDRRLSPPLRHALARDLEPGGELTAEVIVPAPRRPGRYQLVAALVPATAVPPATDRVAVEVAPLPPAARGRSG